MERLKLLLPVVFLSVFLVGCSMKTETIQNAKLLQRVEAREDTLLIFELENEMERVLYTDPKSPNVLKVGERYNVEYSIENWRYRGDGIVEIEIVK